MEDYSLIFWILFYSGVGIFLAHAFGYPVLSWIANSRGEEWGSWYGDGGGGDGGGE